jgi:hypothetical protein
MQETHMSGGHGVGRISQIGGGLRFQCGLDLLVLAAVDRGPEQLIRLERGGLTTTVTLEMRCSMPHWKRLQRTALVR